MAVHSKDIRNLFDYRRVKNAVNRALWKQAGGDQRPVFFDDIGAVSPALADLVRHADAIRAEFDAVYDGGTVLPAYHEVDPGEKEISAGGDPGKRWRVFLLYLLGYKPADNWSRCPQTARLLERVPGLVQAFFSVLDPHKDVPLHEGPYLGYLRFHLGLRVPKDNPPLIRVNGQEYTWREGEGVLFDDSWPHEVVNHSDGVRAVLIVDILRPLTGFPDLVNRFMTGVLAKYTYGRAVAKKAERFVADAKR
jgi:aspartate beta-hydroxylase/beta-hydroxylase